MTNLQSRTLDVARFPLAVMVVFIHAYYDYGDFSELMHTSTSLFFYENIRILFSKILPHIAVPLFYIISGYLFFISFKGKWNFLLWKKKMGRRFWTLLIPYLIWNIIPIIVYCCSVLIGLVIHHKSFNGFGEYFENCLSLHIFLDFTTKDGVAYPLNTPLWFIRDLMFNLCISPLIFFTCKIFRTWAFFFFISYYVLGWEFIVLPVVYFRAVIFFFIGAYFGINEKNLVEIIRPFTPYCFIVCGITVLISLLLYNTFWGWYFYRIYIVSGIISFLSLIILLINKKPSFALPKVLVNSTFFIFAAHLGLPLLSYIRKAIELVIPNSNYWWMILHYFLAPICLVCCCLFIYLLLLRFLPRTTKVICGR